MLDRAPSQPQSYAEADHNNETSRLIMRPNVQTTRVDLRKSSYADTSSSHNHHAGIQTYNHPEQDQSIPDRALSYFSECGPSYSDMLYQSAANSLHSMYLELSKGPELTLVDFRSNFAGITSPTTVPSLEFHSNQQMNQTPEQPIINPDDAISTGRNVGKADRGAEYGRSQGSGIPRLMSSKYRIIPLEVI